MLHDKEKTGLKDVLKLMPEEEVQLLAQTVTSNLIITTTVEEAVDAILLHSPTAESVLLRKRVSREILFKYLHNNSVPMIPTDKGTMVKKILQMWKCIPHEELFLNDDEIWIMKAKDKSRLSAANMKFMRQTAKYTLLPKSTTGHDLEPVIVTGNLLLCEGNALFAHALIEIHPQSTSAVPKPAVEACEIDEMARQFTNWFYLMLNQCQLGMEHFWQDCNMCLLLNSEKDCSKHEVMNSAADVVQLIWDTKTRNNLYFNPNLSHEGVQGRTDVHGLVTIVVCGTLHQQDRCVGIFEQLFGLVRDPSACNNWKIKFTNLNLKGTSMITDLPTLAEGSLLRSVTSVSNPS